MINFFKKKPDPNNIKNFQDILNLIDFYIDEKNWDKANKTLNETLNIEKDNAKREISKIDDKNKEEFKINENKIKNILESKIKKLENLKIKLEEEKEKYSIHPEGIKKYNDILKGIELFILLKKWDKAKKAISEVKKIEKNSLNHLLEKLEKEGNEIFFEIEKKNLLKKFDNKINKLEELLIKTNNLEREYNEKNENEKFKIKFKRIESELESLRKIGKNKDALDILKSFLEDNAQNSSVIIFYNKEKEKILKAIEIEKENEEKKNQQNTKLEAQKLLGKTLKVFKKEKEEEKKENKEGFFSKLKNKINFYKKIKEELKRKKLLDEVTLLIDENESLNKKIASKKLENIHKGLIKEIYSNNINGYDLYGKILGVNRISGDTFGISSSKTKYNLFLGDATGHGIKAGLIVSLITKFFNSNVNKKGLKELAFTINNGLKQDLESRNFITGVLFEIQKNNINNVEFVGMGHEPMLIYRAKNKKVEKLIPGGLAAGIRIIKDINHVKVKKILLEDKDIILTYSDGVLEAKGINGEYYGFDRFKESFSKIARKEEDSKKIYQLLIQDLIKFRGGTAFEDDTTIMLLKRNKDFDVQSKNSEFIKTFSAKEKITTKESKRFFGKTKKQIFEEIQKIKKEKQLKVILLNLKKLYQIGEFLKLKQECIRFIKEGWVHKKINYYLKKAINSQTKYKIKLKNKKIENRYNIMKQLYSRGDYETIIKEIENIISKDGDI